WREHRQRADAGESARARARAGVRFLCHAGRAPLAPPRLAARLARPLAVEDFALQPVRIVLLLVLLSACAVAPDQPPWRTSTGTSTGTSIGLAALSPSPVPIPAAAAAPAAPAASDDPLDFESEYATYTARPYSTAHYSTGHYSAEDPYLLPQGPPPP